MESVKHFADIEGFNPRGEQYVLCSSTLQRSRTCVSIDDLHQMVVSFECVVCSQIKCISPSLESVNDAGDSVLSIACTRGHVSVISYLVKEKGCKLDGEITVLELRTLV